MGGRRRRTGVGEELHRHGTPVVWLAFFRPWRLLPDGKPVTRLFRVVLEKRVDSSQAFRDGARVEPGTTYRFKAKLHPRTRNMLDSADLRGDFEEVTVDSLARADAKVSTRMTVKDPVLGKLVRPPRQDTFEGRLELFGRRVSLTVKGNPARASALFAKVRRHLPKVPAAVAHKMLPLANRTWLDAPITEVALLRRLKLVDSELDAGALRLSFDCGDTFADHGLTATVGPNGKLRSVNVE